MQTLPLAIWGLRPADGTSEQPLQAEAGFAGVLEQTLPSDGTEAAKILGEERLEAGSTGPTALDPELDQAESSEAASDLMALVMSFAQPEPKPNQPTSAPLEAAAVGFLAHPTVVKPQGTPPADPQLSQQTSKTAASDSIPAGAVLRNTEAAAPQPDSKTAVPQALNAASHEPASLSGEAAPSLLSKKSLKQQAITSSQTPLREPTEAQGLLPAAGSEADSGSTSSPEPEILTEIDRRVELGSSEKRAVTAAQNPVVAFEAHAPVKAQGLSRAEGKPRVSESSSSASTATEDAAPKQTNVAAKTSSPVTGLQQPDIQAEHSVEDDSKTLEVKRAAQPLREDAPVQAEASAAVKSSAEGRRDEAASMPSSVQDSESKSSAARSRVDVPSFAHQSDPVSQMLTERWVAWVKQNFSGQDAPKSSVQPVVILPTTPNQAFKVSIQDGQVHMDLPKPVTEVFLSPAAPAFVKTTGAVMNEPNEGQVQEDSASAQIPASMPSHHSSLHPAASKAPRSMVRQPDADPEETPDLETAEASEASEAAAETMPDPAKQTAKPTAKAEGMAAEKAPAPVGHKEGTSDRASAQVKSDLTLDKSVDAADGISPKTAELKGLKGAEAADESTALESGQKPVGAPGVLQSPQSVQVRTSDGPLTPERAEAAVGQAKAALASHVLQPSGQQTVIRLNPDDLGSLTISVKQRGRRVEAEISASLETVRQVLDSQKQELVQAVESKGAQLSHLTIKSEGASDASQNSPMNQQGHQREGQTQREAHQEASRFSRLAASHDTNSSPMTASTQMRRARQSARFDLTA